MTEDSIQIRLTPEFQRKVRNLAKKYRRIRLDIQPVLEQLQAGDFIGSQISGVGYDVMKVRVINTNIQKGKSGGYRLIYWIQDSSRIMCIDIYSKSDREDIEVNEIRKIIAELGQEN